MTITIERRAVQGIELRAEPGKPPSLVGYAAVFNSRSLDLGGFIEYVRPGAFTNSLKEGRDVVALVEHEMRDLVGRRKAGTLALEEDDRGLKVDITPLDTQVGRDLMTNVRAGNLDAMSFGFYTRKDTWDVGKTPAIRELLEVELFDVSVVAFPAYPKTEVGVRSLRSALRAQGVRDLEGAGPEVREALAELGAGDILTEALEEWIVDVGIRAGTMPGALFTAGLEAVRKLDTAAAAGLEALVKGEAQERAQAVRRRLRLRRAEAAVAV